MNETKLLDKVQGWVTSRSGVDVGYVTVEGVEEVLRGGKGW